MQCHVDDALRAWATCGNISLRRDLRTLTDFRLLFHGAENYEAGKVNMISVYLQQYTIYNANKHYVYGIFQTLPLET